jgi:hypothetical protein
MLKLYIINVSPGSITENICPEDWRNLNEKYMYTWLLFCMLDDLF